MFSLTRRKSLALAGMGLLAASGAPLAARSQEKKTIKVATQYGTSHLATTVAEKLSLFQKHAEGNGIGGTEFQVQRVSGSTVINDGIFSGSLDIGAYGSTALIAAWAKTKGSYDLKGIVACNEAVLTLYTNDPSIKSIKDIKPTDRIAVTGTTSPQAILLQMAAEKAFGKGEAKRFDKQMVQLPHPDATTALISGNGVSLYFAAPPFISTLEASKKCFKVVDSREILGGPCSGALYAATQKFANANPKALTAFVGALKEAMDLIRNDPGKAAEIYMAAEKTSLSAAQVEEAIKGQVFTVEPRGMQSFADFLASTGAIKQAPASWRDMFFAPISEGSGS
ncbi:ABC transporter substrate-binding protein [Oryzifoliimicrobium ureilyticus]|uniref:ABC transporter substrate-binding protein n=1 Tax=Oryzifoliimicrobium ureilyticus TaxID=3113724 RepID=UPI003075EE80